MGPVWLDVERSSGESGNKHTHSVHSCEHQTGIPSPGPVGGGQNSAALVTLGTDAVRSVYPWLFEALCDGTIGHFEKLVIAQM